MYYADYKKCGRELFPNSIHHNNTNTIETTSIFLHKSKNYWWRHLWPTSDPTAVTKCQLHRGIYIYVGYTINYIYAWTSSCHFLIWLK